jgi:DNA replication protein DnaC
MKSIADIIGAKPRKPASYELRKTRGSKEDLEFIENFEKQLAEWETKYKELQTERQKDVKAVEPVEVKKEVYRFDEGELIQNFMKCYQEANNSEFEKVNPYSESKEPLQLVRTLLYYFLTDERFFKSPLLSDIAKPSFNKGLLIIGGYGCGKTSTFKALKKLFNGYIKWLQSKDFANTPNLVNCLQFDTSVSTEVVLDYSNSKDTSYCQDIVRGLIKRTPLYIDDILREEVAYNYGKRNIFKEVLSVRADKGYKTYLTCNYLETDDKGSTIGALESLNQFRTKYDGRIYDRLFQMFNVIELTGKSFRR